MALYKAVFSDGSEELLEADDVGEARELAGEYGDVSRVICVRHEAEEAYEDDTDEQEDNPDPSEADEGSE